MTGDNEQPPRRPAPLAVGQAALMLIESLMLSLVEQGVMRTEALVEAVEATIATKRAKRGTSEPAKVLEESLAILATVANTLSAADIKT